MGLGGSYGVERLTHYQMHSEMGPPDTTTWEFPFPDRSWSDELRHFSDAIQCGAEPWSNVHDTLAVMRLVDCAYGRTGGL
jgi:predicted dehydrogenase